MEDLQYLNLMENRICHQRYKLSADTLTDLVGKLINTQSERKHSKRFAVYEIIGNNPLSDIGRDLEREVFDQFFGNDEYEMDREYGPYESNSTFIVVIDKKIQIPVGVLRLISPDNSLKTIVDITDKNSPWDLNESTIIDHHDIDIKKTWDLATLAVKRIYRSRMTRRLILSMLLHSLYIHAIKYSVKHWISILDDLHINTFVNLGIKVESIVNSVGKPYLGSESSTPIIINTENLLSLIQEKSRIIHFFLTRVVRQIGYFNMGNLVIR